MGAEPDIGVDAVDLGVRYISEPLEHDFTFSVCTLLARQESYERLLKSFRGLGFNEDNTQFLAVDNRGKNRFDGFSFVRRCLPECRGKYLIFCHDDIELVDDSYDELVSVLERLDEEDDRWVIAGLAGGEYDADLFSMKTVIYLSDKFAKGKRGADRQHVKAGSVDECFFIMPRQRAIVNSIDLNGFHFYGTDICLQADFVGGNAYIIPFHVYHHGLANRDESFYSIYEDLVAKYRRFFRGRLVQTTTRKVYLGAGFAPAALLLEAKRRLIGPR